MNARTDDLLAEALALDPDERSVLVLVLLDSLDGTSSSTVADEWRTEILKRRNDLRSGRAVSVPWAEARARLSSL